MVSTVSVEQAPVRCAKRGIIVPKALACKSNALVGRTHLFLSKKRVQLVMQVNTAQRNLQHKRPVFGVLTVREA